MTNIATVALTLKDRVESPFDYGLPAKPNSQFGFNPLSGMPEAVTYTGINIQSFEVEGDGITDHTDKFREAVRVAATMKVSCVLVPHGVYILKPRSEAYGITCDERSENAAFGSVCIVGIDTGSRLNRIDTNPHQTFTRGTVLKFVDDEKTGRTWAGKVAIQSGFNVNNFRLYNLTLVGTGYEVNSVAVRHNASASKFEMNNCSIQHWGTAVDIGGDFLTAGDTHADGNTLYRVFVEYCGIGVKVNNFQGTVNSFRDCWIAARIPYWNAKCVDGLTQSPGVNVFGGFVAPLTEYGSVLLTGTVVSAAGQQLTISLGTKYWKSRNSSFALVANTATASISDVVVGAYVNVQSNCSATGAARVPGWGVKNVVTGVDTSTNTITVSGNVDPTILAGKTVWIVNNPAIGFYGGHFTVTGTRIEAALSEDLGFGPMLADLNEWESGSVFRDCDVKLYQNGDFNYNWPKIVHTPRFAFHGSPLTIIGGTWEVSNPKFQVNGAFGVLTKGVTWICEPLFLDANGRLAESVVREQDAQVSKTRTINFSNGALRSRVLQMGADRYVQMNGMLKRPKVFVTAVPTKGSTGEVFEVCTANGGLVMLTISASTEGYYENTAPTGTATVTSGTYEVLVTDLTGIYRGHVITIAGAGTARVLDTYVSDDMTVQKLWLSANATGTVSGAAITTPAPSFGTVTVGQSSMAVTLLKLLGGASGAALLDLVRTDGVTSNFRLTLNGGFLTVRDETNSRNVWNFPNNATNISAECQRVLRFVEDSSDPSASMLTSGANAKDRLGIYMKNDKFVIAYNNAGTVTYIKIPLDGVTTTITHDTVAP